MSGSAEINSHEPVILSALQHYLFCPRQCALIHLEQQWSENFLTAQGRLLHEKADSGKNEKRGDVKTLRSLTLFAPKLGLSGKADIVELHKEGRKEIPFPVEYKRGKPKSHQADEVQLCAQAMCLEEMFQTEVKTGALFYGQTKRRQDVCFDLDLRQKVFEIRDEIQKMFRTGLTPRPIYETRCKACSLEEICQPKRMAKVVSVKNWLKRQLKQQSEMEKP